MDFKSMDALLKYVQDQVSDALKTDVAENSKKLMKDNVDLYVYEKYLPETYVRTGKLKEEVTVNEIDDNTIELLDTREENGRSIVKIIESGHGYYNTNLDRKIGARPFVEQTRNDLKNGMAKEYMRWALEERFGKGNVK